MCSVRWLLRGRGDSHACHVMRLDGAWLGLTFGGPPIGLSVACFRIFNSSRPPQPPSLPSLFLRRSCSRRSWRRGSRPSWNSIGPRRRRSAKRRRRTRRRQKRGQRRGRGQGRGRALPRRRPVPARRGASGTGPGRQTRRRTTTTTTTTTTATATTGTRRTTVARVMGTARTRTRTTHRPPQPLRARS